MEPCSLRPSLGLQWLHDIAAQHPVPWQALVAIHWSLCQNLKSACLLGFQLSPGTDDHHCAGPGGPGTTEDSKELAGPSQVGPVLLQETSLLKTNSDIPETGKEGWGATPGPRQPRWSPHSWPDALQPGHPAMLPLQPLESIPARSSFCKIHGVQGLLLCTENAGTCDIHCVSELYRECTSPGVALPHTRSTAHCSHPPALPFHQLPTFPFLPWSL